MRGSFIESPLQYSPRLLGAGYVTAYGGIPPTVVTIGGGKSDVGFNKTPYRQAG
jgi:hypothetical protein